MKACINCANTKCANYGKPFNPVYHMHKTDIYNCEYREDVTMLDEVFNNRKIKEQEDRIKAVLDDRANKMVKRLDTRSYQLEDEIYANTLEELACLIVDVDDRNMIDTKSIDRIFREDRRTFAYNHARSNGKARLIHLIETKYKKKRGGDTV